MSIVIINSSVLSKYEKEVLNGIKAVFKNGKISYVNSDTMVSVTVLPNKVLLERDNKGMKIKLEFEKNKSLITIYLIKDLNLEIKLETKTKELIIEEDHIFIMYDLFMNDEFSDSFIYELEWSDLR